MKIYLDKMFYLQQIKKYNFIESLNSLQLKQFFHFLRKKRIQNNIKLLKEYIHLCPMNILEMIL